MTMMIRRLWERLRNKVKSPASGSARPPYVVARCIGCGQCAAGCPVAVKITKK